MKPSSEIIATVEKHMSAGHFQDAADICATELTASPSDIPLLALLTAACEHAGEVGKARAAAVRWVEAAPLDSYAHYKLAMIEQRLHNYPAATERLQIAATIAEPDDDVAFAAREALRALDTLQVQQVEALAEVDLSFRVGLSSDPEGVLEERGFALSLQALHQLLIAYELAPPGPAGRPPLPS